jgi:hypothetical protein
MQEKHISLKRRDRGDQQKEIAAVKGFEANVEGYDGSASRCTTVVMMLEKDSGIGTLCSQTREQSIGETPSKPTAVAVVKVNFLRR